VDCPQRRLQKCQNVPGVVGIGGAAVRLYELRACSSLPAAPRMKRFFSCRPQVRQHLHATHGSSRARTRPESRHGAWPRGSRRAIRAEELGRSAVTVQSFAPSTKTTVSKLGTVSVACEDGAAHGSNSVTRACAIVRYSPARAPSNPWSRVPVAGERFGDLEPGELDGCVVGHKCLAR